MQSVETAAFPVFKRALIKYFPEKSADLIENYHRVGESSIEFTGLLAELKLAVAEPELAAPFLNDVLGSNLTAEEARESLIELHDMLARAGEFSEEYVAAEMERALAEKATTDELLGYYLTRRIQLPGALAKLSAPIWVYPAASAVITIALALVMNLIPSGMPGEGVIRTVLVSFIVVAVIIIFISAVAMNGLRGERLHPEREREREKQYLDSKKGGDKPKRRASIFSNLNPFK